MKASVIIPVLYEEPQLAATLQGLSEVARQVDLEILIVVDVPEPARAEQTRALNDLIAAQFGARTVYRVGERGFGPAIRFGFANATGDVLIPYMGDRSDDPHTIPSMLGLVAQGFDVVVGSRYMRGGGTIGNTTKQRLSRTYSRLVRWAGGPPVHDISNAFKAYSRAVVEAVPTVATSFDVSVELALKAAQAGFRVGEVPTVWTNRVLGASSFDIGGEVRNYRRWLALALVGRFGALRHRAAARTISSPPSPRR